MSNSVECPQRSFCVVFFFQEGRRDEFSKNSIIYQFAEMTHDDEFRQASSDPMKAPR